MGRKRKVSVPQNEMENGETVNIAIQKNSQSAMYKGSIYTIMSKVQLNETFHKKYIKELKQICGKMEFNEFSHTFIKMVKTAMVAEETNEFAHTTLLFCAKFVTSFEGDETHPIIQGTFRWLLTAISNNPHIRFRLCQFVNIILNALGNEATLDDVICDSIMEYMVGRLVDVSPSVRVQAILAMQRLQVPDNPDDPVLRLYQYHLCSDPSPRVRQAVITSMGRNYHTIPYILDRLWDIDEKVRRHTYVHMSSYPVRSYKVSQRLTLLEQGLNDRSEPVRKIVTNVMLQQWIESYQNDIIAFLGALKLDANESEINRYRKIGRQVLREIFKRQNKADIVAGLCLEDNGNCYRCVPYERLSLEMSFYWQCLTEYLQNDMAEELDQIVPELSTFCTYVESYCQTRKSAMDKFEAMEFQYVLLSLMEILRTYDLGDEIGRINLQKLLHHLLKNCFLDEKVIEVIVKCSENLITDQNTRHQFFLDIIQDICGLNTKQQDLIHDRNVISELLAHSTDADLNLKLSSLKVKILDLEEQEMNYVQIKDYVRAQQIIEEKNIATEEFTNLLRPLLGMRNNHFGNSARLQFTKVVRHECILKSLQITYYMVVSERVKELGHNICRLYNDFIFRNMASNQIAIRDWALKCGAVFSMLYEPLAKDVFDELYAQFFKNHNIRIWETAIMCIFELLDRYGVDNFAVPEEQNKAKKTGRQLYNTLEFIDADDDARQSTTLGQGVGVIYMMSHFLDTCDDMCIVRAIINGFCRLVLHGNIENRDIIEKLLLRYFNPITDPEINQILGIFLENLIQQRKQNLLEPCLMATVNSVLSAPYDSSLHDIRPETITRFIIDATGPDAISEKNCENSHNKLALIFLNEMMNNSSNKELCKLLAKEIVTLQVNVIQQEELKSELEQLCHKLILNKLDPKTVKYIIEFKDMLDGIVNLAAKRTNDDMESDDEEEQDANHTETIVGTELDAYILDILPEDNTRIKKNRTARRKEKLTVSPSNLNLENETNTTALNIVTILPTTFGSSNITNHRFLRKSLNLSRNNSIESNSTQSNDNITRPTKIRIEARIDSDKKSKELKSSECNHSSSRRILRYSKRSENNNEAEERLSHTTLREPEIIEKILISPTKYKTLSKPCNTFLKIKEKDMDERFPANFQMQHNHRNKNEHTNNKSTVASTEEPNISEVIPASPIPDSPNGFQGITMRLRSSSTTRSMRNQALCKVSQNSDKTTETSSTPLRNGRKRVLQTSPKIISAAASSAISSPIRKQPCIEIDITGTSKRMTTFPRSARKRGLEKYSKHTRACKIASVFSKQGSKDLDHMKTTTTAVSQYVIYPTSNKANEMLKRKSISDKKNSTIINRHKYSKKLPKTDPKSIKIISTRNAAKKELMSKIIMTRKRLSQENLKIETQYLKCSGKLLSGKCRLPITSQKSNVSLKKKTPKNKRE